MLSNWNVTYSTVTPESAEDGDYADTGFEFEGTSFRSAIACFGHVAESADSWPVDGSVRWFDSPIIQDRAYFERGHERHLSLHIPAQITPSSRRRLARLLGLQVSSRGLEFETFLKFYARERELAKLERELPYPWCLQPGICRRLGYCPRNPNCGN
jgi:hypothetical protein